MTFQPPSKSLTTRDYQFIALVVVLFLVISTALVFANLKLEKGGGGFYVHWVAARAFTMDKIEPYGGEVPARTQQLVYGGPAKAGDEPYVLDTPFHILLLYFPFALLSDPALARAIFTLIMELAFTALVYLSLRLTDWEAPRIFTALFILFGIFNYYTYWAIYEATPVLLLGLIYVCIIISYYAETDEITGALIAVSFYYWAVGAPFLFLVMLRAYSEKRIRILAGFFMSNVVLLFIAFLYYPDWLFPFWRAAFKNFRTPYGFNIFDSFSDIWQSHGLIAARILVIGLMGMLGYEWNQARQGEFRRFYWTACLSMAAAPLLGFRSKMEYLAILVIPLALIFSIIYQRWQKNGYIYSFISMAIVFAVPWISFSMAVGQAGVFFNELVFLFLPIITIVGLYWIRWWAIRPPRVWADETMSR